MYDFYSRRNHQEIIGYISPHMINSVNLKNPLVVVWWSCAFTGFGHFLLGNYGVGLILLIHELIINNLMGLNRALFYSFIGDFENAKQTLDLKWSLAYVPPYIFGIWDSYQRAVLLNEDYLIAWKKGYEIISRGNSAINFNRLDIKNPIAAVFWTYISPAAGHIYINRTLMVVFVPFFVLTVYFSNLLPAIHYSLVGNINLAKSIIDPQWVLFLPSIYGFLAYDVYLHTLEYNQLYKKYQNIDLKRKYQHRNFPWPF
ncbi:hypothetical protein [Alkalihalobacillus sp. BA299]|uniref:hypothetical protein n=1 Tax=Alkalihalobacillus sp. BA299 TaxID=2815938 RepID=UPI001ADA9B4B|nr:hypothetical protein [Alkalihalobacillus sp. BA299]